jgi:hypothetical protein
MTDLVQVIEKLEQTVAGLILEVKGMRTHGDSAGYFLQIAVEDLQKTVNELKLAVQK